MKKRLFIIKNAPLGEPQPLSVDITSLLKNFKQDKNIEINLIISKSQNLPNQIRKLCRKIYQVDSSTYSIKDNLYFTRKAYSILRKENKIKKIDLLQAIYPNSSLLACTMFKILNPKTKIIYEVRSPWIDMSISQGYINKNLQKLYKSVLYNQERFLCKFVDHFIFISKGLKDYYVSKFWIGNKTSTIIPSGVDAKIFRKVKNNIRESYELNARDILIGYVGSIEKKRELDDFLKMFASISNKKYNLKLMFVGDGNSKSELEILSKKLQISDKVIFTGKIPHKEIPKYISAFDLGLCHLPDVFVYQNSFPLKILEYLACGVPVLASNINAHRDISEKLNGIFIYSDSASLDKTLAKKKVILIGKKIDEYYWSNLAKYFKEIYKNVL